MPAKELEQKKRGLANEKVWECILYSYKIDEKEPSYLTRGDKIFDVNPGESLAISSNPNMKMETIYSDSENTISKQLATSMNIDVSYGAFAAAASMEVSSSSDKSIKTVRLDSLIKAIKYEVASKGPFRTLPQKFLSDHFKEAVKLLTVQKIEERIGHFYATRLDLGGEIRKSYTMQATKEDNQRSVTSELQASYGGSLLGVSATASLGVSTRSSNSNSEMRVNWYAKGGVSTIWLGKEFTETGDTSVASIQAKWAESVSDSNLYPFDFDLGLMWDLVKAVDQQKGEEFERYLRQKWAANNNLFVPWRFHEGRSYD